MAIDGQDSYEHLRDWYLARLRRQAVPMLGSLRLTPSLLVKADAEVVERLISGKLQQRPDIGFVSTIDKSPLAAMSLSSLGWLIGAGLLFPCFIVLCVCLAFAGDPESVSLCRILLLLAMVMISITCMAIAGTVYQISREARSLKSTISNTIAGDVALPGVSIRNELVWLTAAVRNLAHAYNGSRERERAIADFASSLICSIDEGGEFVALSPACMWILGYTKEQLIGSVMVHLVLPEGVGKTLQALEKAKIERHTKFEIAMRSASDKVVHMDWDIEWSESRRLYYGIARDITELKKLEILRQEFVAMLTHDMRSPLSAIISNTKLLLCGALGEIGEEPTKRLKVVERTGDRLLALVSEILDMDRLDAGKLELDLKIVSTAQIVEAARESVESLAEAKQIQIETNCVDADIVADEPRLVNLIINFLGNAIKFSPAGSVIKIDVAIDVRANTAEFRVSDKGRGIAKEDQGKIFDRFRQLEVEDSTIKGGSGLGLAICKAVAESHNGIIGVDSEHRIGSTFWFRLPLTQPIKQPEKQPDEMSW